uniref:SSD domain-containing protein n=1 Tax=Denticeps clupeoides TaxID=299321 RepID=A0AAY4B7B5_9TELE
MDSEDEPLLLFQTVEGFGEDGMGIWWALAWVYTSPVGPAGWFLGVSFLLPCALSAYMFLYCPTLDIDLSYSAFEVRSHPSAQRFDALAIALKTQLGSWDRHRRNADDYDSDSLRDLILNKLVFQWHNPTQPAKRRPWSHATMSSEGAREALVRKTRSAGSLGYSYLQSQALWRIELVFVAQGGDNDNIFTPERLRTIHHVGAAAHAAPQFQQFCWKPLEILRDLLWGRPSAPSQSLLSYLFPSERGGRIYYDGMGPDLADIRGALSLAITHPQFYWYVDESLTPASLSSSLLRSEIHFGAPLPSFYSLQDRPQEQRRRFRDFVVQYAGILAQQSTSKVKVLYGGTELFDDEVRRTFHSDMLLALFSGACISVLVYILTSFSVFLTFFGLASIGLSCLVTLFLYHVVFGVRYLGILNGVAAFVIIGIGVDDVFVFISTFRQATHLLRPEQRMIYTLKTAGRATFLTSFTTAAAYAANTFSQVTFTLKQLIHYNIHSFSSWLSVLVSADLLVCHLIPPPPLFVLLPVSHPDACDAEADTALLSLTVEPATGPPEGRSVGVVSSWLQRLLRHWVAEPAVGKRKAVIGAYVLVLLASACCCCLLRPASHAPLLFRQDTNLQTLLNLRGNLSAQGISCHTCSGVFMERPHYLHRAAHHMPTVSGFSAPEGVNIVASTVPHGTLLTVYMSKLDMGAAVTLYRFSLNSSVLTPWTPLTPGHGEVPSFQHGWRSEFSFYVASAAQQHSRRLYFAQHRLSPHPSRVCEQPPGCMIGSGPDSPTQGSFYVPLDTAQAKSSKTSGFNPCGGGECGKPAVRPLVDTGAMVFVVFGILGVNRTQLTDNHVIGDMGSVIYDPDFDLFEEIGHLCQLCKAISANTQLVKPGGAQCLPSGNSLSTFLPLLHPECHSLPEPNLLPGQLSHGAFGMQGGRVHWISMAFESTTYKGKSSFQTHSDFLQWENFLQEQLASLPQSSSLQRVFRRASTGSIFMEIIGVESALYSLLLSLVICIGTVAIFTAHPLLLLPILLSILGVVCLVVAIMYWLGWEMGAVEAISLSILVGSSVDYCLHLVEGYLLARRTLSSGSSAHMLV